MGWIAFRAFMLLAAVAAIGVMCREDDASSKLERLYRSVLAATFLAAGVLWE